MGKAIKRIVDPAGIIPKSLGGSKGLDKEIANKAAASALAGQTAKDTAAKGEQARKDAEARAAAEKAKGLGAREAKLRQQAHAGGASRGENEADILQYQPVGAKRRSASRMLLG
jgi:hypothetical protein